MGYTKRGFVDYDPNKPLKAEQLIAMEDAILDNEHRIDSLANGGGGTSSLDGLNVLCLGDSITYGQGVTAENKWTTLLQNRHNWNLTVEAAGGIALSAWWYTNNNSTDVSICKKAEKIATMDPKPDIVIVWGGHNDGSYRASPLGSWDNLETQDTSCKLATYADRNSFKGALRYIAELVHKYAPNATLFVLTREFTSLTTANLNVPEGTTDTSRMFDDAVIEGAHYYGWVPINMGLCGITPFTLSKYTGDNVHPNADGTKLIANYLSSELAKHYRIKAE